MIIQIKFAGIGGQGVQLAGKLLGEAAFLQGLNVSMGVNYEPATSGGLTVADVTLAPRGTEIDYPFIENPTVLIVFAQRAWDEYKAQVTDQTIVLADMDNIQDFNGPERDRARLAFHLPFSTHATELGSEKVTNVMIIGFVSEMLDIHENHLSKIIGNTPPEDAEEYKLLEVDPQYFEESLIKASPKKFKEMNMAAFKQGYQMSLDIDYAKVVSVK